MNNQNKHVEGISAENLYMVVAMRRDGAGCVTAIAYSPTAPRSKDDYQNLIAQSFADNNVEVTDMKSIGVVQLGKLTDGKSNATCFTSLIGMMSVKGEAFLALNNRHYGKVDTSNPIAVMSAIHEERAGNVLAAVAGLETSKGHTLQ